MRTVSDQNVQIARRTFEALRARDIDGLVELYDADIEFEPLTGMQVEIGGYRGHAAVRGRGSGAISDNPMAWVLTLRGGNVLRHRAYRSREEALDAVGLAA